MSIQSKTPESESPAADSVKPVSDLGTTSKEKEGMPQPGSVIVEEKKHHRWGPSRLNYLDECPGFTNKPGTTEAAEEGTFLHSLMEKFVKAVVTKNFKTTLEQVALAQKEHELDDLQVSLLRFACKRVDVYLSKTPESIYIELNVRVRNYDGSEFNHGTLDLLLIFKGGIGVLIDYKMGGEPVRPAALNLQGFNYTVGAFQNIERLKKICCEFIQPKLNTISNFIFTRDKMTELFDRIAAVVQQSIYVQDHSEKEEVCKLLKVGTYCKYCELAGDCAALNNSRALAVSKHEGLPLPKHFSGLKLKTPEDFALARYYVEVIEQGFESLKQRAYEVADENGGEIRCTLPNGREVVYEVAERSADRVLGDATEVSEALKEILTEGEVLGAAKLAIGALEDVAKNAMVEKAKLEGKKLTKKAAWETVTSILEANGLLSRPDTKVRYLRLKKQQEQIEDKK